VVYKWYFSCQLGDYISPIPPKGTIETAIELGESTSVGTRLDSCGIRLYRSWPLWLCCVVLLSPAWLGTWRPFPRRTVGPEGVVDNIFRFFSFLMSNDLFRWDVDVKVRCWWGNSLLFFWLRWLKFYNMFPMVFYKFWFWNPMECVLRWDAREATELAHIYACVLWMGGWWAGHISSGGGLGVISYNDGKMM